MQAGQGLVQRRHVGREPGATLGGHAQHLQLPRLHEWDHAGEAAEGDRHLAAHHVGRRSRRAAIGDVHQVQAPLLVQHHTEQVVQRPVTGGCVVDAARARLRVRDQVLQGTGRERRVGDQQVRGGRDRHHRFEVLDRIETGVPVKPRIDRLRTLRGQHQGVTVLRCPGDQRGADIAAGAGAVLDDHRLAERDRQARAECAGDRVVGAAGGLGHDEGYWLRGPGVLAACDRRCGSATGQRPRREGGEQSGAVGRGGGAGHRSLLGNRNPRL